MFRVTAAAPTAGGLMGGGLGGNAIVMLCIPRAATVDAPPTTVLIKLFRASIWYRMVVTGPDPYVMVRKVAPPAVMVPVEIVVALVRSRTIDRLAPLTAWSPAIWRASRLLVRGPRRNALARTSATAVPTITPTITSTRVKPACRWRRAITVPP